MNAIVMATTHALKIDPLTAMVPFLDFVQQRGQVVSNIESRLAAARRDLVKWRAEEPVIFENLRKTCVDARDQGLAIDLSPLIAAIDARVERDTNFLAQLIKRMKAREKIAREVSAADAAWVRSVRTRLADLVAEEIDAVCEVGIAYRALNHEYGLNTSEPSMPVSSAADLRALLAV